MTTPRQERIEQVFVAAHALAPAGRAAYLRDECGDDKALHAEVELLLASAAESEHFFAKLSNRIGAAALFEGTAFTAANAKQAADAQAGDSIGPYRLVKSLGVGGMAEVWMAERSDGMLNRPVALKLPHVAWRRAGLAERLAREREILASLNHPNIATIYDAGVSDGQPYLALEYVEGVSIDAYCRDLRLDVKARLKLFAQVANAVAFAHAQLIVHRDLKPSNILVKSGGQVRLLDFGIAKLLDEGQTTGTQLTELSGRALTPDYASPEQILGLPITTASDVYSLGVILYELLAGQRPYKLKRASRAALEDAILQTDPPRPSDVAPKADVKSLRGDLDTIALKALKKKPEDRYATVNALVEDVFRYLDGQPVHAVPDSRWYRARKFVDRHRVSVVAATVMLIAILVGALTAVWQARVAIREREATRAVNAFMQSIFRDADPWEQQAEEPTVKGLLLAAVERLDRDTQLAVSVRHELLNTLGASLLGIQEFDAAETALQRALTIAPLGNAPTEQWIRTRSLLAESLTMRRQTLRLERQLDELLPVLESHSQEFPAYHVTALLQRIDIENERGQYDKMETTARRAMDIAARGLPVDHEKRISALRALANALENQRRSAEAAHYAQQAYEMTLANHRDRPKHPEIIDARFIFARILSDTGESKRAVQLMEQSLADAADVLGPKSLRVGVISRTLLRPLLDLGELKRAQIIGEQAFDILAAHYAPNAVPLAYAHVAKGSIALAARNPSAVAEYRVAHATIAKSVGEDHSYELKVRQGLALSEAYAGRSAVAVKMLGEIVEQHRLQRLSMLPSALHAFAEAQRLAGDFVGAKRAIDEAIAAGDAQVMSNAARASMHGELGLILAKLGDHAAAMRVLRESIAQLAQAQADMTPFQADLYAALGDVHWAQGDRSAAISHYRRAADFWRQFDPINEFSRVATRRLEQALRN